MKSRLLAIAALMSAVVTPAAAQSVVGGQYPAPAWAARAALPDCGFAATDSGAQTGFNTAIPATCTAPGAAGDKPSAGRVRAPCEPYRDAPYCDARCRRD